MCSFFLAWMRKDIGRFPFTTNFGKFLLGISVCEERVPFVTSPIRGRPGRLKDRERHGTGDKDNKSVNGTQIYHWEVFTGKTGLPFQEYRLFRKISSGTNQKVVFHLHPNRNFRNFLANGKRPLCPFVSLYMEPLTTMTSISLKSLEECSDAVSFRFELFFFFG